MSLQTPTTAEVSANILAQIETDLGQTVPILPKAVLRVVAKVLAAVFILVYRYAAWTFLQLFVSSASWRETTVNGRTIRPLVEWGRLFGVGDPDPGVRAELVTRITVEVQTGTIPAGAQLIFPSTGVIYITTAAVNLDAATKDVTVKAVSDQDGNGGVGAIGNLDPGEVLSFASPLPNVARDTVVQSQAVAGANAESEEAYRDRVFSRAQRKPQGGAYADYRTWGIEVAGIIGIWPYTSANPGEVDVYVEATAASSGSPDGIPTGAQLTAVADAIELDVGGKASRRPAGAAVNVLAITRTGFDVTITGLAAEDPAAVEAAIEAAVDEYLRDREPFIVGLTVLPRKDRVTLSAVSGVADEVASVLGATITTVTLELSATPIPAYTLGEGELAKLAGPITFV